MTAERKPSLFDLWIALNPPSEELRRSLGVMVTRLAKAYHDSTKAIGDLSIGDDALSHEKID
jgi:hypothetical protein